MASMEDSNYLDTVEGETALFRSIMRARPVGIHRHFHVLAIRNSIHRDTGRLVTVDKIWEKLRSCYDLDILESIEADGYNVPGGTPPVPVRSPSPSDNLTMHPYFRQEFALPHDESLDALISRRRMRATASLPSSSPAPSPVQEKTAGVGRGKKKGKSKLNNMAGLVGGDSDSSALTQESGDESISPTPRGSVATGTDVGTEYAEDDDGEGRDESQALSSKHTRKPSKSTGARKTGTTGRARGSSVSRGIKKRKR